ncbi:MAG: hypothetical protein B6245_18970, partial [Desulfobacteraceae bacterium 4572_88]
PLNPDIPRPGAGQTHRSAPTIIIIAVFFASLYRGFDINAICAFFFIRAIAFVGPVFCLH